MPVAPPSRSVRTSVGRIDGIEALRALAVICVVMFHYFTVRADITDPWIVRLAAADAATVWLRNGYLAVDLFFLMSGFVLVLPWVRAADGGGAAPALADYFMRRIRRIVPAYYAHLAVLFAFGVPLLLSVAYVREHAGLVGFNLAAHALFLQYTTPLSSGSLGLNGALWTLTVEAQFYLLLPFLAPLCARRPAWFLACMLALAAAWRQAAANDAAALVQLQLRLGAPFGVGEAAVRHLLLTQLPGYLGHFGLGMALGAAWLRLRLRRAGVVEDAAWIAGLALAWGFLYWLLRADDPGRLGSLVLWLAPLAALGVLVFAAARGGPLLGPALALRPLQFVGRVSYSLYLYHLPLLLVWNRWSGMRDTAWALPLYLASALGAAWISYELFEKRFSAVPWRTRPMIAMP